MRDELTVPLQAAPRATADWPADAAAVEAARAFLARAAGRVVAVACDSDVDGLAAAVIVERTLAGLGASPQVVPARRGEHVHRQSMQARLLALTPSSLVVVDMGSRPEPILRDIPTLIVDHHHAARGLPPDAVIVNGFDRPPAAPSSVLAYVVCRTIGRIEKSAWLGALGAIADLGTAAPFRDLLGVRAGGTAWTKAVALLNAARRAPKPAPRLALEALRQAESVHDITSGRLPQTPRLEACLQEVRGEIERCSRVAPAIAGNVALLRFSSAAQVHPIVAMRWSRRLRPRIVIAANDGYLPGRTNFAIRSDAEVDLVSWLRGLPFSPAADAEFGHGHARATGGSLDADDFEAFLGAVGFAPRRRHTGSSRNRAIGGTDNP